MAIAKDMDVTLFEILPEELANSIVSYIRFIIPDIAPHISNWLYENKEKKTDTIIQTTLPLNFDEKKSEVEEEVKNIDILNITPIEAINILSKLREKVK